MRLQLGAPDNTFLDAGDVQRSSSRMHGTTMVFLFVVPMMAGFANYFAAADDRRARHGVPELNALSYWLFLFGGIVFYASLFFTPPEAGWTSYAPLSTKEYSPIGRRRRVDLPHPPHRHRSLLGAVNFYATIANMRAPGMGWGRLPLFVWTILIYAILLILALPRRWRPR